MSYSTLYLLPEGGDMIEDCTTYRDYRNSFGTGPLIWRVLWERYCRVDPSEKFNLFFHVGQVWDIPNLPGVKQSHIQVLYSTCDGAIMHNNSIAEMAFAYRQFNGDFSQAFGDGICHTFAIARDLEEIATEHPDSHAFLMINSISGIVGADNPFYIKDLTEDMLT